MPEKETKNGGKNCRRGDWISKTFAELSPERKKIECKWIFSRNIESLLSSRNRDGRGTYILIHVDELILDPEFRIRKTDLEPRRYHYLEMKLSFQPKKTRLLRGIGSPWSEGSPKEWPLPSRPIIWSKMETMSFYWTTSSIQAQLLTWPNVVPSLGILCRSSDWEKYLKWTAHLKFNWPDSDNPELVEHVDADWAEDSTVQKFATLVLFWE